MTQFSLVKVFALVSTLAFVPTVSAMGPFGEEGDMESKLGFLSWKLDLTPDQQIQIAAELEMVEQQMSVEREYLAALKSELRALQSDFDPSLAAELAADIGDSTANLVLNLATSKAAIYQLLDEDQRAELEELIALRDEMRGPGHRRHGRELDSALDS